MNNEYLMDSREIAAQQQPAVPEGTLPQHIRNLVTVLHGAANGLNERRTALKALQQDGSPTVTEIVNEFLKTRAAELNDPVVIPPQSPRHRSGRQ